MLEVSEFLAEKQQLLHTCLPAVENEAMLDAEGPTLAAFAIAEIISGGRTAEQLQQKIISRLCTHIRGRKGGANLAAQDLELVSSLEFYLKGGRPPRWKRKKALTDECFNIAMKRMKLAMTGNPAIDWLSARSLLSGSTSVELRNIAADARFLKFLNRGSQLRSRLAEIWRDAHSYDGAVQAVEAALAEEYFSAISHELVGVYVMTIHKSKGKQFSEVIVYEGQDRFRDRIVRVRSTDRELYQQRLALRVAVTRSERLATILTPVSYPCPLL
jgi:DNA helicase-2/ATP-dependent DNA helicase PcrA